MACSKAEDLINQLIEATLKLLDFGLNIMDALRVQKLLTIRNQKIGLISDDACLPECSLRFSLNFDLMMFNKLLRTACLRARATLNELRVCRLRYPNAPLLLEPKTKLKFQKLQKKIQDFDEAVRSDKMIARRDLRDFREISIIFSQLEHDLKLLICSLECASTMKDTVLFAAPITDVMTVLSIVLSRLERLAQKAEIDEKIAAAEQQKALQDQKQPTTAQSNSATPSRRATPSTRPNDLLTVQGKNSNRTAQQRRQEMTAMIAAASQQNIVASHRRRKQTSVRNVPKESASMEMITSKQMFNSARQINRHHASIKSNLSRHRSEMGSVMDVLTDEISSKHQPTSPSISRRQIKQFRDEFIRQWTDEARHNSGRTHSIMKHEKLSKHRCQASTSSSDDVNQCHISFNEKKKKSHRKHDNSNNNSATIYLQSEQSTDDCLCKIS